jgi:hypothetical protein
LGRMSYDEWSVSRSVSNSLEGGGSETSGVSVRSNNRELVTVDELRGMDPGSVIVLASELPPVLAERLHPNGFLWAEAQMKVEPPPAPRIRLEGEVGMAGIWASAGVSTETAFGLPATDTNTTTDAVTLNANVITDISPNEISKAIETPEATESEPLSSRLGRRQNRQRERDATYHDLE